MSDLVYLLAAACLILALRRLSTPRAAVSGNRLGALGMLVAAAVALADPRVETYGWIVAGLVVGASAGAVAARFVPMTAMPQMVGLLNGFGGGASAIVAAVELWQLGDPGEPWARTAMALGGVVGGLTLTGSLVAFAKLQGILSGRPVTWTAQRESNIALLAILAAGVVFFAAEGPEWVFWLAAVLSLLAGVVAVLPIGGGDMPVVISLLNSYSGVAASMAGFVLGNHLLIVAGALVGAAGLILTRLMCQAMNRSLANVVFGAFGKAEEGAVAAQAERKPIRRAGVEDAAMLLADARLVIVVPGYGLAVARAQHVLRELADLLEARGVTVKYAIHPVAGRMPGHMNVLLAEADVPYEKLVELERINPEFERADVALVVGANDVVNPAARHDRSSPIYGMPILDVDKAGTALVLKRSMNPGFAGIENELFHADRTLMLFGDAQESLAGLVSEVKKL